MKALDRFAIVTIALLVLGSISPASAQPPETDPYALGRNTWISIDGTVASVSRNAFELDFGDGTILVQIDDDDRDAEGYALSLGNEVRVKGIVDDGFFKNARIMARSVYVKKIDTVFHASAAREYDREESMIPMLVSETTLQGTVTSVGPDHFRLDSGFREITVDASALAENPLDNIGYQKIRTGDYVSVSGAMDSDFMSGAVLVAESVTTLYD